jgi:hypothetical protein
MIIILALLRFNNLEFTLVNLIGFCNNYLGQIIIILNKFGDFLTVKTQK